ncbi:diguanylate cyclase [Sphingomonas sp. MMS24-J13]|uniref:diguanylate cyclase n=1 Tax=Sphingomonas sp. MMS24-J13 TaxID=3238686 RepID=UPI003851589F
MGDWRALRRRLRLAGGTGVLFLLVAILSELARRSSGLQAIWPCNALLLGILIARRRSWRDMGAIVAGGLVGSLAFHLGRGDPAMITVLFCVANLVEGLLALLVLRRLCRPGELFDRVSDVLALVFAAVVSTLVSASIGGFALAMLDRTDFAAGFGQWYVTGVLSQLVIAPVVVILAQIRDRRRMRRMAAQPIAELILVLGSVAMVTAAIFIWSALPLLFLITPMVLFATFRLRALGAVAAVGIVAVIAGYASELGYGPILAASPDPATRSLLLQLFVACCFLTALPVAAMLTEHDLRAEQARQMGDRFKAVVENIGEVIFRVDRNGRWAYLNPAWEALTGFALADSLGTGWLDRVGATDRTELDDRLQSMLAGGDTGARQVVQFGTAAGVRWMEVYFQGLRDPDGVVLGATGTLRDIDDRKRLEQHVMTAKRRAEQRAREATQLASTDELTGIANRRAFMRQLDRETAGAAEFGWPLAVAMFDVDHFKRVNDRHGHPVGDKVLQLIAARAVAAVRGGDLVGRLGGEEFGILMPGATAEDARMVAERVRLAIEMPRIGDRDLPAVTVSIGIAAREDQRDSAQLLAVADAALYAAKGAGRNRVQLAA